MQTWIALFRALNVGGNNVIKMADLRIILADLGCHYVQTYIQSGNAIFAHEQDDASVLTEKISEAIVQNAGFRPDVFLFSKDDLKARLNACPFDQSADPKTLHAYVSDVKIAVDDVVIATLAANGEVVEIIDRTLYLLAPNGIGRSKLAAKLPKLIGVDKHTARNWRSMGKVLEMANSIEK